eukprot:scaffold55524_cov38-Cyclotella_meneghiniana.AAC.1
MMSENDDNLMMNLAKLGSAAFFAEKYRESADAYWKAFRACGSNKTHEWRYFCLHGCTSTLRLGHFHPNEDDFINMQALLKDKKELRLFRLEAAYTLGVMYYSRQERMKCEDVYHHAVSIGKKKLSDKETKKEETCKMLSATDATKKTMKELMENRLMDCKKNLDNLNVATRRAVGTSFSPIEDPVRMTHWFPVGMGGTDLTQDMINNLIDVGGIQCDYCKRKDAKLSKCSYCNKGFYCSKECQKKQWREREHKKYCRKEGQFEPGDLVQLARLKNKPEINGNILKVVGRDQTATEERYKLQQVGAVQGDKILSIKASNLNQLRPYDCRI